MQVCAGVFVSSVLLAGVLPAQSRNFTISNIKCHAVSCVTSEGFQEGLTTLEINGQGFQQQAGQSLVFVVVRRGGAEQDTQAQKPPALERKVGVFTDGHLTTNVAVYRLADGVYDFSFHSVADPSNPLATGSFSKTTRAAPKPAQTLQSTNGTEELTGNRPMSAADELVGIWHGLNGTAGELQFKGNGTYILNGNSRGHVTKSGTNLLFDGPLAAWDHGRATLKNGVIEFYWTASTGGKNWFTFAKE